MTPLTKDELNSIRAAAWGSSPIVGINELVMRSAEEVVQLSDQVDDLRAALDEALNTGVACAHEDPLSDPQPCCCSTASAWRARIRASMRAAP